MDSHGRKVSIVVKREYHLKKGRRTGLFGKQTAKGFGQVRKEPKVIQAGPSSNPPCPRDSD
jgi:hypothetical protein